MIKRCAILLALVLLHVNSAGALTRYVAKAADGGSNSNSCGDSATVTTPKLTIVAGLGCMTAGDRLEIRRGTYTDNLNCNDGGTCIPNGTNWTTGAVTIANYNGEEVIIEPTSGNRVINFGTTNHHILIDGLILDAGNGVGYDVVQMQEGSEIRITNSTLRDSNGGAPSGVGGNCLGMWGNNSQITNSTLYDCGYSNFTHGVYTSANNVLIEGNTIYRSSSYGVQIHSETLTPLNAIVTRNTFYSIGMQNLGFGACVIANVGSGHRIDNNACYGGPDDTQRGFIINTSSSGVYNNTAYDILGKGFEISSASNFVRNNIAWSTGGSAMHVTCCASNTLTNNLTDEAIVNNGSGTTLANNQVGTPSVVSTVTPDFHLLKTDSFIGLGYDLSGIVTVDRDNTARTVPYDIGAYKLDTANPTISITSPTSDPTYTSAISALPASGTASDNSAVTGVAWTCPQCSPASGTATGTTGWSLTLSMASGSNVLTVTASDAAGNTGSDVLTVTYNTVPDPPSGSSISRIRLR